MTHNQRALAPNARVGVRTRDWREFVKRHLAAGFTAAALMVAATPAQAAVTVGQSPPSGSGQPSCTTGGAFVDEAQVENVSGNSYAIPPGGGVITSWKTSTTSGTAQAKLRVFTHGAIASDGSTTITPVGESAVEDITQTSPPQFPTRITVHEGEVIGFSINTAGSSNCLYGGNAAGDLIGGVTSGPLGQTQPSGTGPQYLVNVSAVLEPDADKDDYGDETQDLCPTDALRQTACPPETSIGQHPPATTKKKQATFGFSSNQPAATFECSLDGAGFSSCISPRILTVGIGKHIFSVRAKTSDATDATPAVYTWKVKKKRHKKRHHRP
jgi:hypothetical protein